ncbi:sugar transferase [Limosilactobacillus fermentum]|uniref:Undecaprenyl phosphate N,N'-diacetylbacillosamine 1-phosphate transferase n=1 Tax=Limosilactobacillus fermentum TaxID=1613 RepID=A0AAJ4GCP8_LIMFE|nr:sugar transferase [Limosilactobacillus fermentum]MCH5403347.1 sugar transferase [Limosilactobacillus fermentum]MDC6126160.1 sugar transferase [Limosilactobacillus fermentum]MDG9735149.1 sugar transferase [Limosilactobacillus fermentum]QIX57712.1 Undecaprenyl phosphate N,N'-diacetylbacillosamine 1-phosphate transferase [Limosilactobacillus fermentum]WLV88496.1 sugar transferase [Limosilactobacillus fermentum]
MQLPTSDGGVRINQIYRTTIKRIFDAFFGVLLLICLSPLMLVLAIWIKLDSKGPVLFKQERVGRNGKRFTIYKFRSMSDDAPHQMATSEFDTALSYITRSGQLMRKTSLDELPQLVNVVKGEMSFIGPRPLIPKEEKVLRLRHANGAESLAPGITGLAQVRGRDEVTDTQKANYDGEYAGNVTLRGDFSILVETVLAVLARRGVHDGK